MSIKPQNGMSYAAWMLAAILFVCPAFGQVDVSLSPVKSLVGVTNPQPWGQRLLVGVDSSVSVANGMMLSVVTEWPVVVVARCNGVKIEPETAPEHKGQFLFLANGNYVVDIIAFGDKPFTRTVEFQIVAGHAPQPPPKPDPEPDPKPDPQPDVRNDYGLGSLADVAPPAGRDAVAEIYKKAAGFLRGVDGRLKYVANDNGTSTDQNNVLVWIRLEMDKLHTVGEWKAWRLKMADALKASQVAKGPQGYSADDWYKAFMEISDGVR